MTTPLEREILTHYWCRNTPFLGGSENWKDTHVEIVDRFIKAGLLHSVNASPPYNHNHIVANKEALEPYMVALANVPLPVRQWVVRA